MLRSSWSVTYITEDKGKKKDNNNGLSPKNEAEVGQTLGEPVREATHLVLQRSEGRKHTSSSGIKNALHDCILQLLSVP